MPKVVKVKKGGWVCLVLEKNTEGVIVDWSHVYVGDREPTMFVKHGDYVDVTAEYADILQERGL